MKKLNALSTISLTIIGSIMMSASCNNNQHKQNDQSAINTDKEEVKDTINQKAANFKNDWNKKMDRVDHKMEQWQDKINSYTGKKKEQAQKKFDDLKVQKDKLEDKISQTSDQVGTEWEQFKKDVSNAYDSLSAQLDATFNN